MTAKQWTLIGVLGFVAFFLILTWDLMGMVPAIVFTVALGGGLVLWLATTYRIQGGSLEAHRALSTHNDLLRYPRV